MHGVVPYRESLAAQRSAHALLFIDWMDPRAEGVLTGKLFEYLASGRPILCIGNRSDTEAARILEECKAGEIAIADEQIAKALERIAARDFPARPDTTRIRRYSREEQASALLERIEASLASR